MRTCHLYTEMICTLCGLPWDEYVSNGDAHADNIKTLPCFDVFGEELAWCNQDHPMVLVSTIHLS